MAWQRFARVLGGLLIACAVGGSTSELAAQQQQPLQRGQTPGPRFLVPILRSNEAGLGRQAGEVLRERMGDDFMLRTLWIIPKTDIQNTLEASGYSTTEALNPNDLKALAQLLRAEEYVDGTLTKNGAAFEFEGAMLLVRGDGMVQPLPKITANKLGDIAKLVSDEIEKARKQLVGSQQCMLDWRQNKFDEAVEGARKSIQAYSNAIFPRVCLLEIYNTRKFGADSIIRLSEEILKIHPHNRRALVLVADAYNEKKVEDKYIETLTKLLAADPTNTRLQETVVNALGAAGKPEIAKPIIDEAVRQNPGDPNLIRLQWNVYRAMKLWREAATIGEEMIKTDTAAADTSFFERLMAAYLAGGDTAKAAEAAARGAAKFPQNTALLLAQGQLARQMGQTPVALQAFQRALQINPKTPGANLQIALIYSEQGKVDSMQVALRAAIAAGDDPKTAGGMMLSAANRAFQAFQRSDPKQIEEGQRVLGMLTFADSLNPSETAKFLMGATELVLGQAALTKAGQDKSCDLARQGNDYLVQAQIHVPQGARSFPDQAGQLMNALQQLNAYGEQVQKAVCK